MSTSRGLLWLLPLSILVSGFCNPPGASAQDAYWNREDYQPGTTSPQDAVDVILGLKGPVWTLVTGPHELEFQLDGSLRDIQFKWREFSFVHCGEHCQDGGDDEPATFVVRFENDLGGMVFNVDEVAPREARTIYHAFGELSHLSDGDLEVLMESKLDEWLMAAGDQALEREFMLMTASSDYRESTAMLDDLAAKWQAEAGRADTIHAPAPAPGLTYSGAETFFNNGEQSSVTTFSASIGWDEQRGFILKENRRGPYRPATFIKISDEFHGLFTGSVDAQGYEMPEHANVVSVSEDDIVRKETLAVYPAVPLTWIDSAPCPTCDGDEFYPLVVGQELQATGETFVDLSNGSSAKARTRSSCVAMGGSETTIDDRRLVTVEMKCGMVSEVGGSPFHMVNNYLQTKSISVEFGLVLAQTDTYYDVRTGDSFFTEKVVEITEIETR